MVSDANFGDSQDVVYCIDIPFNICPQPIRGALYSARIQRATKGAG
tara:strand:+ start:3444 stop:3581 length:138 start_codon:yes stop_codon:yes gene_type:complete